MKRLFGNCKNGVGHKVSIQTPWGIQMLLMGIQKASFKHSDVQDFILVPTLFLILKTYFSRNLKLGNFP